jgi:hypothetical protein
MSSNHFLTKQIAAPLRTLSKTYKAKTKRGESSKQVRCITIIPVHTNFDDTLLPKSASVDPLVDEEDALIGLRFNGIMDVPKFNTLVPPFQTFATRKAKVIAKNKDCQVRHSGDLCGGMHQVVAGVDLWYTLLVNNV